MAKTVTRTTWESVAAEVAREIQRLLATPAQQDEWQLLSSGVPLDTPEATCQQTFARRLAAVTNLFQATMQCGRK